MGVILNFVTMLRYFGLPISPDETITAQKAYQILGTQQKEIFHFGLRAAIVKKKEDLHIFDTVFDSFFTRQSSTNSTPSDPESYERAKNRFISRLEGTPYQEIGQEILEDQVNHAIQTAVEMVGDGEGSSGQSIGNELSNLQRTLQRAFNLAFGVKVPIRDLTPSQRQVLPDQTIQLAANLQFFEQGIKKRFQEQLQDTSLDQEEEPVNLSSIDSFLYQDLSFVSMSVANVKEQLIEIGRILASREKRRRKRAKRGKLDFRRTFRKNLANNGVPLDLVQKKKQIQDPDIVILNDVSGSTRWVADWFFAITYAAQGVFKKIRIFEFDNTMVEVTAALRKKTINRALEERSKCWEKTLRPRRIHSDYQSSLEDFFHLIKFRPLNRRTTVLILGDCRDCEGTWRTAGPISAELLYKVVLPTKRVIVLNPEDESLWNTGDSVVQYFQTVGAEIFHVATLNDLIDFVFDLKRN